MKNYKDIHFAKAVSIGRSSKMIILSSTFTAVISLVGLNAYASTSGYTPAKPAAHTDSASVTARGTSLTSSRHQGDGNRGTYTSTLTTSTPTTSTPTTSTPTTSTPTTSTPTTSTPTTSTPTTTFAPAEAPAPTQNPTPTTTVPVTTTTVAAAPSLWPLGVPSNSEPSGMAPPSAASLPGYSQSYVTDFAGSSLPADWYTYSGNPGGDPGAQWSDSHVVVANGILSLNAWQDPAYNNSWVTGGLCQCGLAKTYGAYFVRSRLTGAGPTGVELLWPAANVWPPEIDFNESFGSTTSTSATVHYGASNQEIHNSLKIDMTLWHTWGVIWTPTSITYTVDGRVWARVTNISAIPNQAMTLDLQQQTWCGSGWACPSAPQSMLVDWVAEYTAN